MWKPVPGWESRYEVSDSGVVRSKDMIVGAIHGATALRKGRELKAIPKTHFYLCVTLAEGLRRKQYCIHDLVLLAFKGPKPVGFQAAHNDGDRTNNRLSNLRYDTPAGNNLDKFAHGTVCKGETHGMVKLNWGAVRRIRASSAPAVELAEYYGVTPSCVYDIRKFKTWKEG